MHWEDSKANRISFMAGMVCMARELQIKEALDYMYDWLLVLNCRIQTRHTSLALHTFLGEFGITTFILYPMDLRKDDLQGIPTQSNIVDWLH
jgi:hypothetical protein